MNQSLIHDEQDHFALAFRQTFGKIEGTKARRILNILMESLFFYREDDVDLFGLLRRRQSLFRDFFYEFFGWQLYVDDRLARLVKNDVCNPALRPSQRHIFHISGRLQFVVFSLLLEFHQQQADAQNIDLDREPEVRFVLADFVQFVFERYRRELGDQAPAEQEVLNAMRQVFRELQRFRLIAERERQGVVETVGPAAAFTHEGMDHVLYALLPGLRCYRPEALTREDLLGRSTAPANTADADESHANADDECDTADDDGNGDDA